MVERIKTYKQALKYIYAQLPMYQRQGASAYKKDLTNTINLCKAVGNPHLKIKCIHVAGTNGKGTTTHIIAGGLQAQGYKVGVYTSPHYKDFRERIKINGEFIPKEYIIMFLNHFNNELEKIQPSFFEMTVALAFLYFKDQKVDFAVIETGLGGRLDSTNIITPLLSVITNISLDHQNMLGNTLEEIAYEKAGIIKYAIPVIIGEKDKKTQLVFKNKAIEMKAPLFFAEEHLQIIEIDNTKNHIKFSVNFDNTKWIKDMTSDLSGPFQQKNLTTGLYALKLLSEKIRIDFKKIVEFFPVLKEKTKYTGRWQVLNTRPMTIADSAHNEGGITIIVNELLKQNFNKLHMVIGFVNDKDLSSILSILPPDAIYYFAKANIPRGLDAALLREEGKKCKLTGKSYSSVRKAFAAAKMKAKDEDLIFIGGSIFVVAEIL